jgi:antitoxin (DNA-binding transcriptional repressor) of toxin-antitoxin stability system
MEQVGTFETKTKFTSLCEQVVRTGHSVVVSKRGHPMVMLTPVPTNLQSDRPDILTAWREWNESGTVRGADFPEVWKLRARNKSNPLLE